jgi:hypothetical protein
MRDPKNEKKSRKELRRMLASISKEQKSFWKLGKFACRKVLADGTIVTFSITEPRHTSKPKTPKKTRKSTPRTVSKSNGAAASV